MTGCVSCSGVGDERRFGCSAMMDRDIGWLKSVFSRDVSHGCLNRAQRPRYWKFTMPVANGGRRLVAGPWVPIWRRMSALDTDLKRFTFARQGSVPQAGVFGRRLFKQALEVEPRSRCRWTEVPGRTRHKERLSPTRCTFWTGFTWPYAFSM